MSTLDTSKPTAKGALFAFFCLVAVPGCGAETAARQLFEGRVNKPTPAVLDEIGICLEASLRISGWRLKIRIPAKSPGGEVYSFYMQAKQGLDGTTLDTTLDLWGLDGAWVPTVMVDPWDLSHPDSRVTMTVTFQNKKTQKVLGVSFSNFDLKDMLGLDESDNDYKKAYRAGCRKWDAEHPRQSKITP